MLLLRALTKMLFWNVRALLVPVLWHLQRYLSTTLSWLSTPTLPRAADGAARLRRRILWAGTMLVGGLVVFRLPATLAAIRGDAASVVPDIRERGATAIARTLAVDPVAAL